jgi:DNA-binding MarR family transcriptional regulator
LNDGESMNQAQSDIQSPFNDSLGYNCHRLGQLVREQTAICLEAFGITPEQWQLLVFLLAAGEGLTPGELAALTLRDKTTISRGLDVMLATKDAPRARAPLVERRPHPADARSWTIHLTDASRELLGQIRVAIEAFFPQHVFGSLTADEQAQLLMLIQKLRRGLGDM